MVPEGISQKSFTARFPGPCASTPVPLLVLPLTMGNYPSMGSQGGTVIGSLELNICADCACCKAMDPWYNCCTKDVCGACCPGVTVCAASLHQRPSPARAALFRHLGGGWGVPLFTSGSFPPPSLTRCAFVFLCRRLPGRNGRPPRTASSRSSKRARRPHCPRAVAA